MAINQSANENLLFFVVVTDGGFCCLSAAAYSGDVSIRLSAEEQEINLWFLRHKKHISKCCCSCRLNGTAEAQNKSILFGYCSGISGMP